ncbi:peptidase dimerization domain-containing protein, partial [Cupriavidus sp. 2MCAB6]
MSHLIVALQTIVARNVDPLDSAVVSVGMVHGGQAPNQIPSSVTIDGTFRTYRPAVRDRVIGSLKRIANSTAEAFEMRAEIEIITGGRATANTELEEEISVAAAKQAGLTVRRDVPPSTASEDFCHFMADRPGAYVWIGNGPVTDGGELH